MMNRKGLYLLPLLLCLILAARPASAGVDRFTPSSPIDGQILALAPDPHAPGTLLAVTDFHGLFRSEDGGHSWSYSGAGLDKERLQGIAADPANPGNFYAVSKTKAFRSTDGGRHWTTVATGQDFSTFETFPHFRTAASFRLVPAGPGLPPTLLVGTIVRLQRSGDGGVTWSTSYFSSHPTESWPLAGDPTAPGRLWLGPPGGGLLTSADAGQTWVPAPSVPAPIAVGAGGATAIAVLPTSPVTILVASGSRLFKSTDGGVTWKQTAPPFPSTDLGGLFLAYETQTPSIVYLASANVLLVSADAGETWTARQTGLPDGSIEGLVTVPGTRTLYILDFDVLPRSLDRGRHWTVAVAPGRGEDFFNVRLRFDPRDPRTVYAVLDGRAFRSTDGGATWESFGTHRPPLLGTVAQDLAEDPAHPDTFYLATDQGTFRSEDGGASWTAAGSQSFFLVELGGRGALFGARCGVWRSRNGGRTWSETLPCAVRSSGAQRYIDQLIADPRNRDVLYARGYERTAPNALIRRLWKSADGGTSWQLLLSDVTALALDPSRSGRLYVMRSTGLARSEDGGRSFQTIFDFGGDRTRIAAVAALAVDPATPKTLYAGLRGFGVFRSLDGGATWAEANAGLTRAGDLDARALFVHPTVPHLVYVDVFAGIFQSRFTNP